MDQVQAEMAEMRTQLTNQMNTQMTQFMKALTNATKGQQELRNPDENFCRGINQEKLYDDISRKLVIGQQVNENEQLDQVFHNNQGQFPPPPPSHLIVGNKRWNLNGNNQQDYGFENDNQISVHDLRQSSFTNAKKSRDMEQLREELAEIKVQMGIFMEDMFAMTRRQELLKEENIWLKAQMSQVVENLGIRPKEESYPTPAAAKEVVASPCLWMYPSPHEIPSGSSPQPCVPESRNQQPILIYYEDQGHMTQEPKHKGHVTHFDLLPMSYSQLLQRLLQFQLIRLRGMPVNPGKFPTIYDANARCEFHSGGVGHDVKNCWALKCQVKNLLNTGAFTFTPDGSNIQINPLVTKKAMAITHAQPTRHARQQQNRRKNPQGKQKYKKSERVFDVIPMTYGQLFVQLLKRSLVKPK